ncbi:hypothetical protein ABMY11_15635, partial [Vibrio vulnificus]|uniref:hypothetical protein n=1 Tax=Vibrio vulnificus TaxID=672 RepID=UPI004059E253
NVHLELPLDERFRHLPGCGVRLPQLLHWLPVNNATLKHSIGLAEYWALRCFGRLPTYAAEAGSLTLCTVNFLLLPSDPAVGQQRPCNSDYLPLSQGDSGFFQPDGFASFAGQTKKELEELFFVYHFFNKRPTRPG